MTLIRFAADVSKKEIPNDLASSSPSALVIARWSSRSHLFPARMSATSLGPGRDVRMLSRWFEIARNDERLSIE